MSAGSVESKTTGYLIWGRSAGSYATEEGDRYFGFGQYRGASPLVYPTVEALLDAIEGTHTGPISIHKQIEKTTTITTTHIHTERLPLE